MSGRPEQLAAMTSSQSTTGAVPDPITSPEAATLMNHEPQQSGRELTPIPGGSYSSGTTTELAPAQASHFPSLQVMPADDMPSAGLSPLAVLHAFRRRWPLAVGLGTLAALIAGTAAWFLVPPAKFETQVVLQVFSRVPMVVFPTAETQNQAQDEYKRYQKTQVALVKSRNVLLSALQQLKVGTLQTFRKVDDPVSWLKENLEVAFINESEIFHIGLKGEHPEEIAKLVNAVKDAYMDEVVNVERSKRTRRYDKLKEVNLKKQEMLARQRQHVRALAESLGSNSQQALILKQQFAMENQAIIDKELLQVQSERRRAEAELSAELKVVETVADGPGDVIDEATIEEEIANDPSIIALEQQLAQAEARLRQHGNLLTKTSRRPGTDPTIQPMQAEVRRAREELKDRRRALRPMIIKQLRNRPVGKGQATANQLRQRIATFDELEKRLMAEKQHQDAGAKTISTKSFELEGIQEDIQQAQIAVAKMGSEIQALEVELEAPARVTVIETAEVPRTRDEKKRLMMIGVSTLGAFLAVLFGILFWEVQSQKVSRVSEVASGLGLKVLGTLPAQPVRALRGNPVRGNALEESWQRVMYESIDMTRTMLLNIARMQAGKVFMVTSAMSGEGKTSLSCHLATSLARSGRKTIVIDMDLRRPSLHHLFSQPPGPGISEVLRGELPLEEAITATEIPGLELLAAGECDDITMCSLSQGGIAPLFDRLKATYDCVIVDTAPVLPVTDTLLVAPFTDGVLLSVLTDVSRMPKITETRDRLTAVGVKVLGTVFIGERLGIHGYYNRHGYDYCRRPGPAQAVPSSVDIVRGEECGPA